MTIPSLRSLIFEVKSTGSELAFIRVLRLHTSSEDSGLLRKTSDFFGILRKSLEMIVSSSKIPALPGQKSHAYISEKVGRYTLKARLHRRFLSQQLDAIFVAPKLQLQNRMCKPVAISSAICRSDIAGVSNMFET